VSRFFHSDGRSRILRGRWLPLSTFNLDQELGYDPDMLAGLQLRKRGLLDALGDDLFQGLPAHQQVILEALFWERTSAREAGRRWAEAELPPEHQATVEELAFDQWRDDPRGTQQFMRQRIPDWERPRRPARPGRTAFAAGYHHTQVKREMQQALAALGEAARKWVETQLSEYMEESDE
jgi:hypothetical protein